MYSGLFCENDRPHFVSISARYRDVDARIRFGVILVLSNIAECSYVTEFVQFSFDTPDCEA